MPETTEVSISYLNILLFGGVIVASIWSWTRPLPKRPDLAARPPWQPWNLSVVHILLLAWLILMVILIVPHLAHALVAPFAAGNGESEKMDILSASFLTQLFLLGVVIFALHLTRNSFLPFFFQAQATSSELFTFSLRLFFRYLPLVWLVGLYWASLLIFLESMGVTVVLEPQLAATWIAESHSLAFLVFMGFLVVVVAPVGEEMVFRGFLYRLLAERISPRFSLIFTSLVFSAIHASLHGLIPLFFLGMLLTKVYEDTRDIRVPIFFHAIFNLFSFLNLMAFPSP